MPTVMRMHTHRTLTGEWHRCMRPEKCKLLFHFPDQFPRELAAMPEELLLPLLNAIQPSSSESWRDGQVWETEAGLAHRDYDLPAYIAPDGRQEWWRHGMQHRGADRPAIVGPDGLQAWYTDGHPHRLTGPAVIAPQTAYIYVDGRAAEVLGEEWWLHGKLIWSGPDPIPDHVKMQFALELARR